MVTPPRYTAEQYNAAYLRKLPNGPAWAKDRSSKLYRLVRSMGEMWEDITDIAANLIIESNPATTTAFLEEWERTLGIPGKCGFIGETVEDRRLAILAKLGSAGGASIKRWTLLAATSGYEIRIREFSPPRVGNARIGDRLYDYGDAFLWVVEVVSGPNPAALECAFREIAPAHLRLSFLYDGTYHEDTPFVYPKVSISDAVIGGFVPVVYPGVSISDAVFVDDGEVDPGPDPDPDPVGLRVLSTLGNQIVDSDGNPVVLTGTAWHGAEGSNHVPHILWQRKWMDVIDQVKGMGINCLRIPLSAAMDETATAESINTFENPDLVGLTAIQVLDEIVDYCAEQEIYVILDCHRTTFGAGTDSDVNSGTMPTIVAFWQRMATRYGTHPAVVGAECLNEPHTVPWATLAGYYETIGNAIHAIAPTWLIVCQGGQEEGYQAWWGAALRGVATRPVTLTVPNKVVYAFHDYGLSVSSQPWLKSSSNLSVAGWPNNLDSIWEDNFGFIHTAGTAPLICTEFGGWLGWNENGTIDASQTNAVYELEWFNHLVAWMEDRGMSSTFWTLTNQSADTGGLLCADNVSEQTGKIALLVPLTALT